MSCKDSHWTGTTGIRVPGREISSAPVALPIPDQLAKNCVSILRRVGKIRTPLARSPVNTLFSLKLFQCYSIHDLLIHFFPNSFLGTFKRRRHFIRQRIKIGPELRIFGLERLGPMAREQLDGVRAKLGKLNPSPDSSCLAYN